MEPMPLTKNLVAVLLLVFFAVHMPCISGQNEWCGESGGSSTDPLIPTLDDGSSQDEDFTVNDKVILFCCFISKHPFQVKWYKNDIPITTGVGYHLGENDQVLSIAKGIKSDGGRYRCEGFNKHGRESWNITVTMHLPPCNQAPTIYRPRANVTANTGETVTLTCIVHSQKDCSHGSMPSYYWRNPHGMLMIKKTKIVPTGNRNIRMTLTIKHATKSQTGAYKCLTMNSYEHSKASSKVHLNVN